MLSLKAETRQLSAQETKALRSRGFLPAVLYGAQVNAESISVSLLAFEKVFRVAGESVMIQLEVGGNAYNVLIYDIAYDPLRDIPIHADFYAVRMDKNLRVKVPLVFIGEAPAVRDLGGVLVKVLHEVQVEALPQNLPHELSVDLGTLADFASRLLVRDILLPGGVEIRESKDEVIALVEAPRSEEELAALEKKPDEGIATVQTEQEARRELKAKSVEETDTVSKQTTA